jgi:hypothetical protein
MKNLLFGGEQMHQRFKGLTIKKSAKQQHVSWIFRIFAEKLGRTDETADIDIER